MNKTDYIPSIQHLVSLIEQVDKTLSPIGMNDRRHLHKVKNWLREKSDRPTSAAKINRQPAGANIARGIAI